MSEKNLKAYIDNDSIFQNYITGAVPKDCFSDFDWFCINHCRDIENILNKLKILENENEKLKSQLKGTTHCFDKEEHKRLQDKLDKINEICENPYYFDKDYCLTYGELCAMAGAGADRLAVVNVSDIKEITNGDFDTK